MLQKHNSFERLPGIEVFGVGNGCRGDVTQKLIIIGPEEGSRNCTASLAWTLHGDFAVVKFVSRLEGLLHGAFAAIGQGTHVGASEERRFRR